MTKKDDENKKKQLQIFFHQFDLMYSKCLNEINRKQKQKNSDNNDNIIIIIFVVLCCV